MNAEVLKILDFDFDIVILNVTQHKPCFQVIGDTLILSFINTSSNRVHYKNTKVLPNY